MKFLIFLLSVFQNGSAFASGGNAGLPDVSADAHNRILSGQSSSSCAASSTATASAPRRRAILAKRTLPEIESLWIPLDLFENHPAKASFEKSNFFVKLMKDALLRKGNTSHKIVFAETMRIYWRNKGLQELNQAKIPKFNIHFQPSSLDPEKVTLEDISRLWVPEDLFEAHPAREEFEKSNQALTMVSVVLLLRQDYKAYWERFKDDSDPRKVAQALSRKDYLDKSPDLIKKLDLQRVYWREAGIRRIHGMPPAQDPPAGIVVAASSAASSSASSASASSGSPAVSGSAPALRALASSASATGVSSASPSSELISRTSSASSPVAPNPAPIARVKQGWRAKFRSIRSSISGFFSSCWKKARWVFSCFLSAPAPPAPAASAK